MDPEVSFKTFEILSIFIDLIILVIVFLQFINTHCGDCRGMIMSRTKTSDGQLVTRQAKLSMHEKQHESFTELKPIHNDEY
jgi:hypothetical protein